MGTELPSGKGGRSFVNPVLQSVGTILRNYQLRDEVYLQGKYWRDKSNKINRLNWCACRAADVDKFATKTWKLLKKL